MFTVCPACGNADILVEKPEEYGGLPANGFRMFCFNAECPTKSFDNSHYLILLHVETKDAVVQTPTNTG